MPEEDHALVGEDESQHQIDRRTVLGGATVVATALAGCTGSSGNQSTESGGESDEDSSTESGGSEENTTETSSDVFNEVGFEGVDLQVTLTDTDSVAQINLIEDDEVISSSEVSAGGNTLTLRSFDSTVREREFEFAAVNENEEVIDSITESFSAEPTVNRIRSAAVKQGITDVSEEEVRQEGLEFTKALITVENSGNAPFFLGTQPEELGFVFPQKGVPTPLDTTKDPDGAYQLPAGESHEFQPYKITARSPLAFQTSGEEPNNEWPENIQNMGEWPDGYADGDTVSVELTIVDGSNGEYSASIDVTYSDGMVKVSDAASLYVARRVTSE